MECFDAVLHGVGAHGVDAAVHGVDAAVHGVGAAVGAALCCYAWSLECAWSGGCDAWSL